MTEEDEKPATGTDDVAESRPPDTAAHSRSAPAEAASAVARMHSGANAIAWLALLLVLALAAAGVWALLEAQQRESDLRQRLQGIEIGAGRDLSALDQINRTLERQIELEVAAAQTTLRGEWQDEVEQLRERAREIASATQEVKRLQQDVTRRMADLEGALDSARQTLDEKLATFDSRLARQRARLEQFSADDRDSWLLAEAQYLLRLANQRLVMTADTDTAEALMRNADGMLRELGDAGLHAVRAALAADLAAVRAVPRLDLEGIYLRLNALIEQSNDLIVFELPETAEELPLPDAENWRDRLRLGYDKALQKLSDYVVFRRRDLPVETLMDPQWEGLVRQNLRMLLQQAQVAMLSGNQHLFEESLMRARDWVSQFFASDEQAAQAIDAELDELASTQVSVEVPDASRTLQALQTALAARAQDSDAGEIGAGR